VPRQPRSNLVSEGFFHVTARGTGREPIFVVDLDRLEFSELLRSTSERFLWLCDTHCLMGAHYHLILNASREALSAGMQRLNGVYAQRFNRRHGRRGHLFATRFSAWVVRDEHHLEAARRYVLDNPVRAGLCQQAEDWPWSASAPVA
jgi:putative transposase